MNPATVNVPVRAGPILAATEKETVPSDGPLLPLMTVIQLALLAAIQGQLLKTSIVLVLPAAGALNAVAEIATSSHSNAMRGTDVTGLRKNDVSGAVAPGWIAVSVVTSH
jgi:hypothetical protein